MLFIQELCRNSVIVAAKRTPIGAFQGQFSSLSASDLGASVIKQVLIDANSTGPDR